jgi:membrane-associated phospholipid phosphatase
MMRQADKPSNCLPSLHVGICYLFSYGFYNENKKKFGISFFISTLIAISTLTTKQHYIYDIVLGFILATAIHLFFHRYTKINIE